jgi:magnesium transporter
MTKGFKKRSRKAGLPPGSLVHIGNFSGEEIEISLIDYSQDSFIEKNDVQIQECLHFLSSPSISWIHVRGIHDTQTISTIGQHFGSHPLMLEDIVNTGQRAKLDDFKDQIFIVMRLLKYNFNTNEIVDEQVSMILGNSYVISFVESHNDIFDPIRKRLRNPESRLRHQGADYLFYTLIDCIVDNYFIVLEAFDNHLEKLEDEIVLSPSPRSLQEIQHIKRDVNTLRRSIWPLREVINNLRHVEKKFLSEVTRLHLGDVYDHAIQAIDMVDSFRDISASLLEIYSSNLTLKTNEIVKVLTMITTMFVPLTFIASIYGMNFSHMPEIDWVYGYPIVLLAMALTAGTMTYYFYRKKWLFN